MNTYAQLETAYLALCRRVEADAMQIFGLAGVGRSDDAAEAAAALADHAATCKAQYAMQHEQGHYDLSALKVDASTASNSETGWEQEK